MLIGRLIKNIGKYVEQHPNSAQGHYTLGRLHSLAFARSSDKIYATIRDRSTKRPLDLLYFAPYDSVFVRSCRLASPHLPFCR